MPHKEENLALPAPQGLPAPAVAERIVTYPAAYTYAEPEPEEATVPLSHYLWIMKRHRWRILAFVVAAVLSTIVISSRLTPIYESTAMIDIDRQIPANAVGQGAGGTQDENYDADQFLATQIRLAQSDSVLRPVVQRFNLSPAQPNSPDSRIPTARFEEAPVALSGLRVTRPSNTYLLLITYRNTDPKLAADVANEVAASYIKHTFEIRFTASAGLSTFMERQLEQLKAKMEASAEKLGQFEKDMGVIDPEHKTDILSARLLQLNTEFTNAQADRVRKEAAFNSVQSGSLEAAQASTQGDQLRKAADGLREARQKFASVRAQYGANHPEFKKAASLVTEFQNQFDALKTDTGQRVGLEYQEAVNRESMLSKAVDETKADFDKLNARSFEYKAVKQEADSDRGLYQELLLKIKEAGINSGFQSSSIRLADAARPSVGPVFPNVRTNATLAFLLSTLIALGAAILSDTLDQTVRDPEQILRQLKTEVLGSLPIVRDWRGRLLSATGLHRSGPKGGYGSGQQSAFEEAVRTLRDSILLSDLSRRPRSLLITSAVPREGKTTTSLHLAIAHSTQKRKTLLIDADLRRPGIHSRIGIKNDQGLSTVVNEEVGWRELLQTPEAYPYLDILAAGPASRRAADRLGGVLESLLAQAEKSYDLIIVDSPPLLGFAEPLQIAAVVDGVVVVTLAGQTNRTALGSVLTSLRRLRANVIGVALNEVRADMSDHYYYYGYYGKYYSKYYKPTQG